MGLVLGVPELPKSWIREALNTMTISRSGRPVVDQIRYCSTLGSTIPDTAAVLRCTVEHVKDLVGGKKAITIDEADRVTVYLVTLYWWHCARLGRPESLTSDALKLVFSEAAQIWQDLPRQLRDDWLHYLNLANKRDDG